MEQSFALENMYMEGHLEVYSSIVISTLNWCWVKNQARRDGEKYWIIYSATAEEFI